MTAPVFRDKSAAWNAAWVRGPQPAAQPARAAQAPEAREPIESLLSRYGFDHAELEAFIQSNPPAQALVADLRNRPDATDEDWLRAAVAVRGQQESTRHLAATQEQVLAQAVDLYESGEHSGAEIADALTAQYGADVAHRFAAHWAYDTTEPYEPETAAEWMQHRQSLAESQRMVEAARAHEASAQLQQQQEATLHEQAATLAAELEQAHPGFDRWAEAADVLPELGVDDPRAAIGQAINVVHEADRSADEARQILEVQGSVLNGAARRRAFWSGTSGGGFGSDDDSDVVWMAETPAHERVAAYVQSKGADLAASRFNLAHVNPPTTEEIAAAHADTVAAGQAREQSWRTEMDGLGAHQSIRAADRENRAANARAAFERAPANVPSRSTAEPDHGNSSLFAQSFAAAETTASRSPDAGDNAGPEQLG